MPPRLRTALLYLGLTVITSSFTAARTSEWKDGKGVVFKGEPAEVVGPFAVFRTGPDRSLSVRLSALSPQDCVRFHRAVSAQPAPAAQWQQARGAATRQLVGKLDRVSRHTASSVDFSGLPEPELLLIISRSTSFSGHLVDNIAPFVSRLQRVYGDRIATVAAMSWSSGPLPGTLPITRDWLALDLHHYHDVKLPGAFLVGDGVGVAVVTRHGTPLLSRRVESPSDLRRVVDEVGELLSLLDPKNPFTAVEQAHYLRQVRPLEQPKGYAPPLPLGPFLREDFLRKKQVARVDAKIDIAADGMVTRVLVQPGPDMPETLRAPLGEALRRSAVFAPAVKDGQPIPATYDYTLAPGREDKQLDADRAWLSGEVRADIPLPSWLVLKAVRVDERDFIVTAVDKVGTDGTLLLKPVTAGGGHSVRSERVQRKSFERDWFSGEGAASVHPKVGDQQEIDDTKLTWKTIKADEGLVDFMEGSIVWSHDYSYGYAWTEIESLEERDAWLGLGSDDGVKVWFNGELVDDNWRARVSRLDEDVIPVRLKQGKNAILIKLQNIDGRWNFTARLRTRGTGTFSPMGELVK